MINNCVLGNSLSCSDELEAKCLRTTSSLKKAKKYVKKAEINSAIESDIPPTHATEIEKVSNKDKAEKSLEHLGNISMRFENLVLDLQEIKKNQAEILVFTASHREAKNHIVLPNVRTFVFPLESTDDIIKMETNLTEEGFASDLVVHLAMVGQTTLNGTITAVMKKVFSRTLAVQYSARGRKNKLNFSALKLCDVVVKAIRVNFPKGTQLDIMKRISVVLAQSGDWNGGKKQRNIKYPTELDYIQLIQNEDIIISMDPDLLTEDQ
ncbi:uncharacterized protein LOC113365518 [Ctenocephalides felis]|uniref:uncharacterized protein LOC113365518 n=2 Tax=Ctenocephalides felis TaxID=7515 RepID=UPI000E6E2918|nr:uncharacterized protein LOC113365518 [Ctenocephalides felis]